MKLFITGATGFVGSHVLARADELGLEVTAHRLPGSAPKFALRRQPAWVETPLDKINAEEIAGNDVVLHLASVGVSPQKASLTDLFYWNVTAAVRLFEKAFEGGVRRFVVSGTCEEYGLSAYNYQNVPPEAPLRPVTAYASSKAAFYAAAHGFVAERKIRLDYLRLFHVFGEGQFAGNFWPSLKAAALSGRDFEMTPGEQIRDFCAVEKAAERLLDAALHPRSQEGVPYVANLASGASVTLADFARNWWEKWDAKGKLKIGALPYRENEVMRYVPELEKGGF